MAVTGITSYQQEIQTGKLYKVTRKINSGALRQQGTSIEVIGNTVDIYGSQAQPTSAPTNMFKTEEAFSGIQAFGIIPNFLYIADNSGTPTSVVLSGVNAVEV